MKRPSFQFYPADWQLNKKLARCSEAAQGAWIRMMCFLHDQDEYGVARMPLNELAAASHVKLKSARELQKYGVLKGGDSEVPAYIYRPRHAGKVGEPVTLLEASREPLWYCSRFVRDEWLRGRRGVGTRFTADNQPQPPTHRQGESQPESPTRTPTRPTGTRQGDGASSSSSVSISNTVSKNVQRPVDKSTGATKTKAQLADQARAAEARAEPPGGSIAKFVEQATGKAPRPTNGAAPHDEPTVDPEQLPEPTPARAPAFRLGDDIDPAWRESPDGIDHAGITLGMARIPFEPDQDYAQRIEQRLALDTRGSP